MRFTLPKLFFAVTLAAIVCVGLSSPTRGWVSTIVTITIAIFAISALRAFKLRGREMVFALVFSFSGALYLILSSSQPLGQSLLTNYPIAWMARFQILHAPTTRHFRNIGIGVQTLPDGTSQEVEVGVPSAEHVEEIPLDQILLLGASQNFEEAEGSWPIKGFFLIGHCVWSWLIALLAGCFAGRMYAKRNATVARLPAAER